METLLCVMQRVNDDDVFEGAMAIIVVLPVRT